MSRDGLFRALFPLIRAHRFRQTEMKPQDAKLPPEPRNRVDADYGKMIEQADRHRDAMQYAERAGPPRGGRDGLSGSAGAGIG
jgi:hypothetical protein